MIGILLRNKIRTIYNSLVKHPGKKRTFQIFSLIASFFLFYMLMNWANKIFGLILDPEILPVSDTERQILLENSVTILFNGIFLFLFMGGISISIHYLYAETDLNLLLSAPVPLSHLFAFKTLEAIVINTGIFFVIGGAFAFGLGLHSPQPWHFFGIGILATLLFISIPTTLALTLTLTLVHFLPATRLREMASAATGVLGLGIWILIQYLRPETIDPRSVDHTSGRFENMVQILQRANWDWTPAAWFSKGLAFFILPSENVPWASWGILVILTLVLFVVSFRLAQTQFLKFGLIDSIQPRRKTISRAKIRKQAAGKKLPSRLQAMIYKDLKLMFRDPRIVVQIILMMVISTLIILMMPNAASLEYYQYGDFSEAIVVVLMMIVFLCAQNSSRLIPLEGRAFWLVKNIPMTVAETVFSKLLLSFFLNQIALLITLSIVAVFHQFSMTTFIYLLLLSVSLNLNASAVGILIGAWFPRFDWVHPKRMLQQTGSIMTIIISIGVFVLFLAVLLLCQFIFESGTRFLILSAGSFFILASGLCSLMQRLTVRRVKALVPDI